MCRQTSLVHANCSSDFYAPKIQCRKRSLHPDTSTQATHAQHLTISIQKAESPSSCAGMSRACAAAIPVKNTAAARLKRLFQNLVQLHTSVPTQARMRPYTTCNGPEQMLYTRLPEGMAMPLQTAKPTMAPMLSNPADAISMDGMTAQGHATQISVTERTHSQTDIQIQVQPKCRSCKIAEAWLSQR